MDNDEDFIKYSNVKVDSKNPKKYEFFVQVLSHGNITEYMVHSAISRLMGSEVIVKKRKKEG